MCMIAPPIRNRLKSEGFEIRELNCVPGSVDDAKQTILVSKDVSASWIVLDGYHFDATYQRLIKEFGIKSIAYRR